MPCAGHPRACTTCTKAPVSFVSSITCFSIPFTSRTCLMCSQAASCQQLTHGQPSYTRAADRPHLPGYQQAQPSHWWVTVLDRSKVITCSYLNSFGLWNSVRPLWACWWFHSWSLGSTMGWLLSLSCLRACVHRRGASSQFTYANGGGHSEVWRCSSLETPCITHQPPKSAAAWRILWAGG